MIFFQAYESIYFQMKYYILFGIIVVADGNAICDKLPLHWILPITLPVSAFLS